MPMVKASHAMRHLCYRRGCTGPGTSAQSGNNEEYVRTCNALSNDSIAFFGCPAPPVRVVTRTQSVEQPRSKLYAFRYVGHTKRLGICVHRNIFDFGRR